MDPEDVLQEFLIPNNRQDEDDATVHTNNENPILEIPVTEKPINFFGNQIIVTFVNTFVCKPKLTNPFPNKNRVEAFISNENFEKEIIDLFKECINPKWRYGVYFSNRDRYENFITILQKTFKNKAFCLTQTNKFLKDETDLQEQESIITNYHLGKTNHRGIDETYNKLKTQYYWPKMREHITRFINNCEICQLAKYERNPNKPPLQISPTPNKPNEIISIDLFQYKKQKFLTVIDDFSKFSQAYPVNSSNALDVVNKLLIHFSHHCTPLQIRLDGGPEFNNTILKEFCRTHNVKLHFTTAQHPQSNGTIERLHSTLLEHLRIIDNKHPKTTPCEQMTYAIIGYNNSIHATTNLKPVDVYYGHIDNNEILTINLNEKFLTDYVQNHRAITKTLYQNVQENIHNKKQKTTEKINETRKQPPNYPDNTQAYIKTNPRLKHDPRAKKATVQTDCNLKVKTSKGTYHKQQIKKPLKFQTMGNNPDNVDNEPRGSNN